MMNILKYTIFIILFLHFSNETFGQNFFKGGIIVGLNLSQIDGDQLAGYDKLGLSAGLKVEFPLSPIYDLSFEFLFSQRGSRSQLIPGNFGDLQSIHLNYAEIPILIKWNDWWVENEEYYKVHLHGGFSPGRLVNYKTNLSEGALNTEFSNYDFSLIIGGGYSFSKNITLAARYTRSLNRLYTYNSTQQTQFRALRGYFITIRSEYLF